MFGVNTPNNGIGLTHAIIGFYWKLKGGASNIPITQFKNTYLTIENEIQKEEIAK